MRPKKPTRLVLYALIPATLAIGWALPWSAWSTTQVGTVEVVPDADIVRSADVRERRRWLARFFGEATDSRGFVEWQGPTYVAADESNAASNLEAPRPVRLTGHLEREDRVYAYCNGEVWNALTNTSANEPARRIPDFDWDLIRTLVAEQRHRVETAAALGDITLPPWWPDSDAPFLP